MQFDLLADLAPPTPAALAPGTTEPPLQLLLNAAFEQLPHGTPFRSPGAAAIWASDVTGAPYVPGGTWTLDDVYDAVEGAAHRILAPALSGLPFRERLLRTREREEEWFHGRALTEAARAQAQFSTPLPIAESAAHLITCATGLRTILEPCAGTGSLVRPLLSDSRFHLRVNETDGRRREVLAWLGFEPSARDALRFPLDPLRVDAVLSNPPFGAITRGHAGRGATEFALTNIAQRFAAAHLHSLRSGSGLLVALLPASTLSDAGAGFRRWLDERHTPLLFLGCPAGSYRTRGALRDAMLLVALRGQTATAERIVVPQPSWEEWADVVEATAARLATVLPPSVAQEPPAPLTPALSEALPPPDTGAPDEPPAPSPQPADEGPGRAAPVVLQRRIAGAPISIDFGTTPAVRAIPDWEREAQERVEAEASPVFTPFVVSLAERRAPHPRLVVQTRSMAGMPPPPLVRQRFESPFANDAWGRAGSAGGASDEQAELSLRVLDAWDRLHGFLCADDVGVGKSRELALLVLEAIHEGETRILITTKNETNVRDLEAELRRVASGDEHGPFPAQLIEVSNYVEAKGEHGVLPRPHGAAVYLAHSYNFADFAPALAAVHPTVWMADEAHEYSNIADSKRGLAWASLHETMLAYTSKFAYFTATPAVTLDQLCYLYGLRQWHVGAFDLWLARKTGTGKLPKEGDKEASHRAVQTHVRESVVLGDTAGVDADQAAREGKKRFMARRNDAFVIRTTPAETEQVMRELQASGHYMSRDLWRGGVRFEVDWIDILSDPEARRRYDEAAAVCRDLSRATRQFGAMNEEVKTQGLDRAMVQSYLKQVLFDLRLDAVLAQADAALAEGHQVVISVHSVAGDEDDIAALGSDAQEHASNRRLESAINRINVRQVTKERSENETVFRDLGEIPEALLARESLRERARALPRLRDPVRIVSQHFGASRVAAITGRIPARLRTQRMGDFQAGTRQVALISRAGKVGISLHDTNGRPRTMLVADYEWSADLFKQELGRVDRTGQRSAPRIILMASTAAGERKFAATIAARMASLGATCKGSAEATGTDALDVFDMAGGIALEAMKNAVQQMEDEQRAYFTGSQFVERQVTRSGAILWIPKHRPEEGTQMRHFLLEMLMFPLEESHGVLAAWEEARNALLTFETLEALSARRTGRARGAVLRERALPATPPMALVDVEYEDGEHGVIARGFVTEHMVRIQQARGPDSKGNPRTRRYVQFTGSDGRLLSGLDLTTSEAHRVRWAFGTAEQRDLTPGALLQDMRTGEKITVTGAEGARWMLHLRRDGRIEIRGAKLGRDRAHLMRPSLAGAIAYEAVGNFFHLTSGDVLGRFIEHFPVADDGATLAEAA